MAKRKRGLLSLESIDRLRRNTYSLPAFSESSASSEEGNELPFNPESDKVHKENPVSSNPEQSIQKEEIKGLSVRHADFLDYYESAKLNGIDDTQVLELLLQYALPLADTKSIADSLMKHFGSLSRVLDAGMEPLLNVSGMTREAAVLLDMILRTARRAVEEQESNTEFFDNIEKVAQYLTGRYYGMTKETVMMICLDNECRMLCCLQLSEGSAAVSRISLRQIVEEAIARNASGIILAHNHPNGTVRPSAEDIQTTGIIGGMLEALDITLIDHVIISGQKWCSLSRIGKLQHRNIAMP